MFGRFGVERSSENLQVISEIISLWSTQVINSNVCIWNRWHNCLTGIEVIVVLTLSWTPQHFHDHSRFQPSSFHRYFVNRFVNFFRWSLRNFRARVSHLARVNRLMNHKRFDTWGILTQILAESLLNLSSILQENFINPSYIPCCCETRSNLTVSKQATTYVDSANTIVSSRNSPTEPTE